MNKEEYEEYIESLKQLILLAEKEKALEEELNIMRQNRLSTTLSSV